MLLPDFSVDQTDCKSFIFRDITPEYSPEYPGGYGSINVDADRIMKAEITIDFGLNGSYVISKIYNKTMPAFIIMASDLPYKKSVSGCSDCGTPCGCEGCNDAAQVDADCRGMMVSFPEGCLKFKYEVFSVDQSNGQYKSEGIKIKQVVNSCHQRERLLQLVDKVTGGSNGHYDFYMTKEKKFDIQSKIVLAWTKLELTNFEQDCDCNCIESRIKRVRLDLDSIKL